MAIIKLAVKDFAQPLKRRGSLSREGSFGGIELGSHIHAVIQKRLANDLDYHAEEPYKHSVRHGRYVIQISGRADGVFAKEPTIIEEIKSTAAPKALCHELATTGPLDHAYKLQLLTYAYFHELQNQQIPEARLRIAGFRDNGETLVTVPYERDRFAAYFASRIEQITAAEDERRQNRARRRRISREIKLPFAEPRPQQEALLDLCRGVFKKKQQALVQAPTGIGKTIGFLLPSLENALKRGSQTVYVAPKNSQFRLVGETCRMLADTTKSGAGSLKFMTLVAKPKLCLNDEMICHGDYCPYAKDYFDKISDHDLVAKLKDCPSLDRETLQEFGRTHEVCPYYLSHEILDNPDVIIADYNYVFSPRSILPDSLDIRGAGERPNLLIDEVHNLYERALEYYSPSLSWLKLQRIKASPLSTPTLHQEWQTILADIESMFAKLRPQGARSAAISIPAKSFTEISQRFSEFLLQYLTASDAVPEDDVVMELFFEVMEFTSVMEQQDHHTKQVYLHSDRDEKIALICCNAAAYLAPRYGLFHGIAGFSATTKPFEFYARLCGFDPELVTAEMPTPFPNEHRKLLVVPQVSTAYRHRQAQYPRIAEAITRMAAVEPGHYFVFTPSYEFLNQLKPHLAARDLACEIRCQEPQMTEPELEVLCTTIKEPTWLGVSLIMGVQGGRLAEGLDLHSPYLKGVFVVGPAVPLQSFERNLRRDYYDEAFGEGFNYAYVYPAMAKSIQAAGRVIRSQHKRGLIVLLDRRFLAADYSAAMPDFWYTDHISECVETGLIASISDFWQQAT